MERIKKARSNNGLMKQKHLSHLARSISANKACNASIDNPYLDLVESMAKKNVTNGYVSIDWNGKFNKMTSWNTYCWGIIPTNDDACFISNFSPIVEIGAGSGYWAYLIHQAGATIHSYDKFIPTAMKKTRFATNLWFDVKEGGPEILSTYNKKWTLLLIRPPSNPDLAPMAKECLKNFKGNRFIYAGEMCKTNANASFFKHLYANFDEIFSKDLAYTSQNPNYLKLYHRKAIAEQEKQYCDKRHMVNDS